MLKTVQSEKQINLLKNYYKSVTKISKIKAKSTLLEQDLQDSKDVAFHDRNVEMLLRLHKDQINHYDHIRIMLKEYIKNKEHVNIEEED